MIDVHTHRDRCGHAEGCLVDVARWATERGVRTLGFADHAPRFADPDDHPRALTQMARSQWDGYLAEAVALREAHAIGIDVRVGVEANFLPGTEDVYRAALARSELDYVIGSVHEVAWGKGSDDGTWNLFAPDSYAGADLSEVHRRYWQAIAASVGSGLFDVLGHLDLIRMLPPPAAAPRAQIEAALDAFADAEVAVETNGSGMRRDGRPYPDAGVLAGLIRRGVPLTFGSDAHRRGQLGLGWHEARALLARHGVDRLVAFRGRQREEVRLS